MWSRRDRIVKSSFRFAEGKRRRHKVGAGSFGVVNGRCRRFVAGPILRVGRLDVNTYLLSPPEVQRVTLPHRTRSPRRSGTPGRGDRWINLLQSRSRLGLARLAQVFLSVNSFLSLIDVRRRCGGRLSRTARERKAGCRKREKQNRLSSHILDSRAPTFLAA